MYKKFALYFTLLILLCSCNPSVNSGDMDDVVSKSPVYTPTPKLTTEITTKDGDYLKWLNQYTNLLHQSISVSPDGMKISSRPDPFELGKDKIKIFFENNKTQEYDISVDNYLLELPLEALPDGKINLYGGSNSADSTTWSPDSSAFLIKGASFVSSVYNFIVIIDISKIDDVDKTIIKWEYEGFPYTAWSPDSSRLLIWFGPEIPLGKMFSGVYTETAWIVDRQGNKQREIDVKGFRSPLWVGDQLYAIKNENEIWRIDPNSGKTKKLFANTNRIIRILDHNQRNAELLLIEDRLPYDLLIINIPSGEISDRITSQMADYQAKYCYGLNSSSNFTGLYLVNLFVFNWTTHKIKKYNDQISSPFWSPVVKGFIGEGTNSSLFIIYP
jgi:hypothetical protein